MNRTIRIRLEYEVLTDAMNAAVDQRRYREPEILQTYRAALREAQTTTEEDTFRLEPEPPTISMEPAPRRCARDDQHTETQQEES